MGDAWGGDGDVELVMDMRGWDRMTRGFVRVKKTGAALCRGHINDVVNDGFVPALEVVLSNRRNGCCTNATDEDLGEEDVHVFNAERE